MSINKEHSILVSASTEQIADVRNFVGKHANQAGFTPEDVDDIRLAVDEAYTNVIKHAYNFDPSKLVNIKVQFNGQEFLITIADEGRSFNPDTYTEPNIKERIMLRKRGGVGVYLIHKLMDRVEYRKQGIQNEIVMSKKL
ncbi:MAG TPA: ATP-binding protein [Bacteroidetes bacterium]|nr:ATP-binding protein [Bacteroidota bacterium]